MKSVVGEEALTAQDRLLLEFLSKFESKFLSQVLCARVVATQRVTWRLRADSLAVQDFFENRDIFNSLELGWELLRILPTTMLGRIKMKTIDKYVSHASRGRHAIAQFTACRPRMCRAGWRC